MRNLKLNDFNLAVASRWAALSGNALSTRKCGNNDVYCVSKQL